MKRKRDEIHDVAGVVVVTTAGEGDGPVPPLWALPDLVHHQLVGWLDVGSALRFAGTSRVGRELVLRDHRAARLVVQFLVRRLMSVAGSPSSPDFTSLTQARYANLNERNQLFAMARDQTTRLPVPDIVLGESEDEDGDGLSPAGDGLGASSDGRDAESESESEGLGDDAMSIEESKSLWQDAKLGVLPHPREGLLAMLDAVWVRVSARLRQHKIEQEYWAEHNLRPLPGRRVPRPRLPPASKLAQIVSKHVTVRSFVQTRSRRYSAVVCMLEISAGKTADDREERYVFNVREEVKVWFCDGSAEESWFLEAFYYPPKATDARLVLSNLARRSSGDSQQPRRRHIDVGLLQGLSSALGLDSSDLLPVVVIIALSAGCQSSLAEMNVHALTEESEDEDEDEDEENGDGQEVFDRIDLNSSPALCTMVPPFDGEFPEVDAFFDSRRHIPADVLRDLKHLVRRWRLLLELPRAYIMCADVDWVEVEDVMRLLPFISPEKGVCSLVEWRCGVASIKGEASFGLHVPVRDEDGADQGQLRITVRQHDVYMRNKFSIRAAASTPSLQRRFSLPSHTTDVFHGRFDLAAPRSDLGPPFMCVIQPHGAAFFDELARTFDLPLRVPGTDLRVQTAVLLAVCCLPSCPYYEFLTERPFVDRMRPVAQSPYWALFQDWIHDRRWTATRMHAS